jgi:hypothetical protein
MSFQKEFWLAVAAAAPVIALASLVSLSDTFRSWLSLPGIYAGERLELSGKLTDRLEEAEWFINFQLVLILLTLLSQVGVFTVALISLGFGRNLISPIIVIVFMPLSFLLLFIWGFLGVANAGMRHQVEKILKEDQKVRANGGAQPSSESAGQASNEGEPV